VADLASSNGTFVNGRRVTGATALTDHDVLRLGDAQLTFVRSSSESGLNRRRLAYVVLSLVAIGGIGFTATCYFVAKPNGGWDKTPKQPIVAVATASPLPTTFVPTVYDSVTATPSPVPTTDPILRERVSEASDKLALEFNEMQHEQEAQGNSVDDAHVFACGDFTRTVCRVRTEWTYELNSLRRDEISAE